MSDPEAKLKVMAANMLERASGECRQEFNSFFLSRLFGFLISYENEKCIVEFDAIPTLFNPQGSLHGGVMATALDVSMGHLLHRHASAGATLEMKIQYLAPIRSGLVTCRANFLRRGRSISYLQSQAFRSDGELAAHATSTWKLDPNA